MGSALPKLEDFKIQATPGKAKAMAKDRRREARFPLGLPVGIQLAGRPHPITVELLDLSARGGRFRSLEERDRVRVDEAASIAFVLQDQSRCFAEGRVIRSDPSGVFAMRLEGTNDAFVAFIRQLHE
jgi:hypothetical protein